MPFPYHRLTMSWFSGGLTALGFLAIVIVWIFGTQYSRYKEDLQAVRQQIDWCNKRHAALRQIPALEKEMARLEGELAEIDRKLPTGSLHQNSFLKAVEESCVNNGVTCQSWDAGHTSATFYESAQFEITFFGPPHAVYNTLSDIDSIGRVISWDNACYVKPAESTAAVAVVVTVKIFSCPPDPGRQRKPLARREIETHTWLPPFSSKLKKLRQEGIQTYDSLFAEPAAEEKLQFIEQLIEKTARWERMNAVLTEIRNTCSSLDQAVESGGACPQESLNRGLPPASD